MITPQKTNEKNQCSIVNCKNIPERHMTMCKDCHIKSGMHMFGLEEAKTNEDIIAEFENMSCFMCRYFEAVEHQICECPRYTYNDMKSLFIQALEQKDAEIKAAREEAIEACLAVCDELSGDGDTLSGDEFIAGQESGAKECSRQISQLKSK